MGKGKPRDANTALDLYIFDHLMKRNLLHTARTFLEEKKFETDFDLIDVPGGFLYDWWSVFWESYYGTTVASANPGNALEHRQPETNHHFAQAEEQMWRDAGIANLLGSTDAVINDGMHQYLVDNSTQMHSHLSAQFPGIGRMDLPYSTVYSGSLNQVNSFYGTALEHMQQLNQQSTGNISMNPSSSEQNIMQTNFALTGCGMNEVASGLSSQARLLAVDRAFSPNVRKPQEQKQCSMRFPDHMSTASAMTTISAGKVRLISTASAMNTISAGKVRHICTASAMNTISAGKVPSAQKSCGSHIRASDAKKKGKLTLHDDAVSKKKTSGDAEHKTKGITSVVALKASSEQIVCCDFSSDGKLLTSAGVKSKVFVWSFGNNIEKCTWEAHSGLITDIRFRPNDTMLATSSCDKTVRLWNTSERDDCLQTFVGHSSKVRSVDFHPTRTTVLCSSDDDGKIFFWTTEHPNPRISTVEGRGKVRFQPYGFYLASAARSKVNIINVETDKRILCLEGSDNNNLVRSICWNEDMDCLASVTEDCVKLWSSKGECVHKLRVNQNHFRSCTFHPKDPNTLVIGGYQTITLWNFAESKGESFLTHGSHIADLARSCVTGMLASASHDGSVKIWN